MVELKILICLSRVVIQGRKAGRSLTYYGLDVNKEYQPSFPLSLSSL